MKLIDFFDLCVNDYMIYIYVSENHLVYKGLLDKFDKGMPSDGPLSWSGIRNQVAQEFGIGL